MIEFFVSRMRRSRENPHAQGGFTLIELLVVIIILGILAAVVVFAIGGVGDKGQNAALRTDHKTLRTAEEAYFAQNSSYGTEAQLVQGGFLSEESTNFNVTLSPAAPPFTSFSIVCAPNSPCALPTAPINGGTLVYGVTSSSTNTLLNPAVNSEGTIHNHSEDMFNGLLKWDAATNTPVGDLADTFAVDHATSNTGANTVGTNNTRCTTAPCTTAVFTLNSNVKWHNGDDVTPADVEFTFEKALLPFHSRTRSLLASLGSVPSTGLGTLPADAIEITGETIQFNFSSVVPALTKQLNVTEAAIIPKNVYQPCSTAAYLLTANTALGTLTPTNACPANRAPVGSGPFKFQSVSATEIKTVKNPLYSQFRPGLPYLAAVTKLRIPVGTVATSLQNGTIDVGPPAGIEVAQIRTDPLIVSTPIARGTGGSNCIQTWAFNTTESRRRNTSTGVGAPPPTGTTFSEPGASPNDADELPVGGTDSTHLAGQGTLVGTNAPPHRILGRDAGSDFGAPVREAIWRAFDRQKVVTDVLFGAGKVATSPFHSSLAGYVAQSLPPFDSSAARSAANALLDAGGWNGPRTSGVPNVPDGTRTAKDHPNENHTTPDLKVSDDTPLTLTAIYSSPSTTLDPMAALFKADLKLIGINLVLEPAENSPWLAPKVFQARDFDIASASYCNGDDAFAGVRRQWHSSQVLNGTSFTNASGYKNSTMDGYWNGASVLVADIDRQPFFTNIQTQAVNGIGGDFTAPRLPAVWIYESNNVRGTRTDCTGFNHNNTGLFVETGYCRK